MTPMKFEIHAALRTRGLHLLSALVGAITRQETYAVNAATQAESSGPIAIGAAVNVAPIGGAEEWNMISPYGEFPNPLGLQIVNREIAEGIVAAFNSVWAKLGRLFRGAPVYRGHPDVMPERWPDDKRYGRYDALEAREDGLYGKPSWNSAGQENVREGFYVYPSPAWHFRDLGNGRIAPTNLVSVGLTNTPNIASAVPVTNSQQQPTNQNQTMFKKIAEKFGLSADADEGAILAAINALQQKVEGNLTALNVASAAKTEAETKLTAANAAKSLLETQLSAASANVTAAQAEAKKFRDKARDALATAAINEGRLPAAELTAVNAEFDADFEAAATKLAARQKALNTSPIALGRTATGDLSTPEGRRLAFNARIDELTAPVASGGKGLNYPQAVAHMRASTADAALIQAMESAA